MHSATSADRYSSIKLSQRMPLREAFLLGLYQLRMLNWWVYLFMALGFVFSAFVFWFMVHSGTAYDLGRGTGLSRFVLESGAGLISGMLASSLLIGDPLLEIAMATPSGIYGILFWRYLIMLIALFLCSCAYLLWSLHFGVAYADHQSHIYWFTLLVWLAPVLLMSMLGLLSSLLTRNASLGTVIAAIPLMAALFMHDDLLTIQVARLFFIPYTYWGHDASDWWLNRWALIGIASLLAFCCWCWLRREERLLGNLQ